MLRRLRWPRSARHAKGHALVLAVMLWVAAAAVSFTGTSNRGIAGPLKGADFAQFYTLGHLAHDHRVVAMYDGALLHEAQVALIPESAREIYPPVYPPQAAMFFAPASVLSYQRALLVWSFLTIAAYGLIVWSAWKAVADVLPDRTLVIAAAAAFPPFWSLVLHGQVTIVLLASFWAAWIALERQHRLLAGLALGLLAIKPQFGIPLAIVALACGEWTMIAGAVTSVLAQAAAVGLTLGARALTEFAASIPTTIAYADLLEAKPFMSHSLRALTRLGPNWIGLPLWATLGAIILWYAVRVWKSGAPVRVRLGTVILASTLVNPHVIIYDLTVLALPLIWFGAYLHTRADVAAARVYGIAVYWLFATTFMPTAAVIGLQASVFLMLGLLVLVSRAVQSDTSVARSSAVGAQLAA